MQKQPRKHHDAPAHAQAGDACMGMGSVGSIADVDDGAAVHCPNSVAAGSSLLVQTGVDDLDINELIGTESHIMQADSSIALYTATSSLSF